MASKKIHLFRQSAVEAGTPKDYYINPSEKLMTKPSDWSDVEHKNCIETIFNISAFEGAPIVMRRYNNQALGDAENKIDEFSYIVNADFINHKEVKAEMKNGVTKTYYPKIKVEENKKNNNKNNKN